MRYTIVSLVALAASVAGQNGNLTGDLLTSLANRTDVSVFKGFLSQMPTLIDDVFADSKNDTTNLKSDSVTLLIPDNDAISAFLAANPDVDTTQLQTALKPILRYHVMAAPLTSTNFSEPSGLTIPTFLDGTDEAGTSYNLRDPAPAIQQQYGQGATGQVLFAKLSGLDGLVRLRTRQDSGQSTQSELRSGMGQTAMMSIVDGTWAGGVYQIVNSILQPPTPCSETVRALKDTLSSLDVALNKTSLWPTLNVTPNVTCLAPSSSAFQSAGNPQDSLSVDDLKAALLDHTLVGPAYSNYLVDGMTFATVSNHTVRVTLNDSGIWFNDAKVIQENVLTNNGLIHILDTVMTVDDTTNSNTPSSTTGAGGSEATGSVDNKNGAGVLGINGVAVAAVALAAVVLV